MTATQEQIERSPSVPSGGADQAREEMSEKRWADELIPDEPQWVRELVMEELSRRDATCTQLRADLAAAKARHTQYLDGIRQLLERVRQHRPSGEPSRSDRQEIGFLVYEVLDLRRAQEHAQAELARARQECSRKDAALRKILGCASPESFAVAGAFALAEIQQIARAALAEAAPLIGSSGYLVVAPPAAPEPERVCGVCGVAPCCVACPGEMRDPAPEPQREEGER